MLVIGRRASEEIFIGDDITIRVIKIKNKEVKIGITAPLSFRVSRPRTKIEEGTKVSSITDEILDTFIDAQVKLLVEANDQVVENAKLFHKEHCKDPSPSCEATFMAIFMLGMGLELKKIGSGK